MCKQFDRKKGNPIVWFEKLNEKLNKGEVVLKSRKLYGFLV